MSFNICQMKMIRYQFKKVVNFVFYLKNNQKRSQDIEIVFIVDNYRKGRKNN